MRGSLSDQGRSVLAAVARGALPANEAAALLSALSAQAKIAEFDELNRRLEALEAKHAP